MNATAAEFLREAAGSWSSWMVEMTWQVVLLVILLAIISVCLRRRSSTFGYALWLLIVVRLILPPDLVFPTGWGWWLRPPQAATSVEVEQQVRSQSGSYQRSPLPIAGNDATMMPAEKPGPFSLSILLMIGWLGIVAARLGMLLTAALQVRVWVSRARPITDPRVLDLLEDSRQRVGVRRAVSLCNSESCATPLVVGLWRPVILLPSTVLDRLEPSQLRAVLIHELYHVKRWDGVVNLLQGLLGAVYFFHPLVWWANRRIRQLREDACDEQTVAALNGHRKPYGEAIFKVAEILGYAAPPLALGVLDSKTPLKRRLNRILDPQFPTAEKSHWPAVVAVIAAGAILIPSGARPAPGAHTTVDPNRLVTVLQQPTTQINDTATTPDSLAEPDVNASDLPERAETETPENAGQQAPSDMAALDSWVHQLTDPRSRAVAVDALTFVGPAAEPAILRLLGSGDQATRTAIYQVLEHVGTDASVLALQTAVLDREVDERQQAKRALDAVYERIRGRSTKSGSEVNSVRIFK